MPIDTNELQEWLQTDDGKAWNDAHTSELRTEVGTYKGKAKEFEEKSLTLSGEVDTLKADLDKAVKTPSEIDADTKAKISALEGNLKEVRGQNSGLMKKIQTTHVNGLIDKAIKAEGGNPDLLYLQVRTRTVVDTDSQGNSVIHVVDDKGNKMYDQSGNPAGVDTIVRSLKTNDNFKPAFKAEVKPGSGHHQSSTSKPNDKSALDMDVKELNDPKSLESLLFK
ncbi:hypothetical protein FCV55_04905 [Vibrio sp. F13]|uniref:Phage protein n=2 Tax=Vibrio cyclitrophicus TaxID=47951 RepID=A0A7Z1MMN3_9VIBR|nr:MULTISPECIES: hypothetical protein [Vibrio]PMP14477.1 hypothetical protein BCS91_11480 [Vibrio cyclitrophicus]PMP33003.1 hypothetical protein BCS90_09720 [Vibrio cyclitrophicus]TKF72801.1 hypothetical protein FCV55_04905 [Vibrio sp. F13]